MRFYDQNKNKLSYLHIKITMPFLRVKAPGKNINQHQHKKIMLNRTPNALQSCFDWAERLQIEQYQ